MRIDDNLEWCIRFGKTFAYKDRWKSYEHACHRYFRRDGSRILKRSWISVIYKLMRALGFCVYGIADMNERENLTSEFKGSGVISPINLEALNEWTDLLLFRLYCRGHPHRCWGERSLSPYGKDNGGEKNGRMWLPQQESQKEMMFTWCPPGGG